MTSFEIRQEARKSLTGKWGKGALATLIFLVLDYIISFVLNLVPIVGSLAASIIAVPLSFGFTIAMMSKLKRNEDFSYLDFFTAGFEKFVKVWQTTLWIFVKMLAPIAIILVGAIIGVVGKTTSSYNAVLSLLGSIIYIVGIIWSIPKYFSYKLSLYLINDNPDMLAKEAVEKSAELMKGHRWAYFWLQCTFIGWALLACLTIGIGMFWLIPYMHVANVTFYDSLVGNVDTKPEKEETIEEESTEANTVQ